MDTTFFTSLGIGGVALWIIYKVIESLMGKLDKKDEYIKSLIIDFQGHVELCNTNFIKNSQHVAKMADKQAKAIDKLVKRVTTLEK